MHLTFHKYQATGNDFIIIDNRKYIFPKQKSTLIAKLCDRKFGIGADGVILIEQAVKANFEMVYYNPDGSQSFCGNGSRAAVKFAQSLGMINGSGTFVASDGVHETNLSGELIQIKMADVQNGRKVLNGTFIDTGSPHYIEFVNKVDKLDIVNEGKKLRYAEEFEPNGSNINFVEILEHGKIKVRTYERGVENETLSCGTGVTASALAAVDAGLGDDFKINTRGGELHVWLSATESGYANIWLEGPAKQVFAGEISI